MCDHSMYTNVAIYYLNLCNSNIVNNTFSSATHMLLFITYTYFLINMFGLVEVPTKT